MATAALTTRKMDRMTRKIVKPVSAKTESHWTHAKIRMVSSLSKPRARSKKEDKKRRSRKALSGTIDVGMQLQDADIEV